MDLTEEMEQQLRDLQHYVEAKETADAHGGDREDIRALLDASRADGGGYDLHGYRLRPPTFGALQVLDQIDSPLMAGGDPKLGDIASALCVLEDAEKCWGLLSQGTQHFLSHVWQRTSGTPPAVLKALIPAMLDLVNQACGRAPENPPATPAATAAPAVEAKAAVLTPAGSPPASTPSSANTAAPSTTPSGSGQPAPPASSPPQRSSVVGINLQDQVPQTAPPSPPPAFVVPG